MNETLLQFVIISATMLFSVANCLTLHSARSTFKVYAVKLLNSVFGVASIRSTQQWELCLYFNWVSGAH